MKQESALFFLKPDGAARRAAGADVLSCLFELGPRIEAFGQLRPSTSFLGESHYAIHRGKPFHPWLVQFVSSGPVVAAILRGENLVAKVRSLLGATFPENAAPESVRGRFGIVGGLNVAHASDSPENGEAEAALWRPLIESAPEGSTALSEATSLAETYVDRYRRFERVETARYRTIHRAASDRRIGNEEARERFADLLDQESDLDRDTLDGIATAMVANALMS